MSEIRKVRLGDMDSDELNVYVDEVYNNVKPTHTNKFEEHMYNEEFHKYDWKGLKRSILEDGYDIDKHNPIRVHTNDKEIKYYITDGQHRVFMLREMFGEDHMIDVDVNGKKRKSREKKSITHYIELINGWLFPGYLLIFHTIPLIVMVVSFYLIQKYLPDNQTYKTLKKGVVLSKISDVSEQLYMVVLNIINNTQMILYLTIAGGISLYMLITDFYGIVLIIILNQLIKYILSKFKKEEKGDK